MSTSTEFAVGIDLGTTNCTMAALPMEASEKASPQIEEIPQVVNPGETASLAQLPSFIYLPPQAELQPGAFALPWDPQQRWATGRYGQQRGAQVPTRVLASAKSWLCHSGVDRRQPILPWQAPEDVERISPVEASARYLGHLKQHWDHTHPDQPLGQQSLVITVPASFDAVARGLTEEALGLAGMADNVTLLEEPQAALYAWVASQNEQWRKQVAVGDLILVCDIGGGTTDFSLIAVKEEQGSLALHRVAVGDHILLGGDNMDLALAYRVKAKLEGQGKKIDDWQLRAMTHSCRSAKEGMLATQAPNHPVVVPSRGSKLIGGTISTELTRDELDQTLLDGFFPEVSFLSKPQTPRRTGLQTMGLPYAADAGITRHLAAFLAKHKEVGQADPEHKFLHPTAVLFNGGVSNAPVLRDRIIGVLNDWLDKDQGQPVKILQGEDPDLAVARGAAYYARVRQGTGIRIRGGTARSYYVGIERAELAVPGIPPQLDAICVAPCGMEEGTEVELEQDLALVVGEDVSFRFFASSSRRGDGVADAIAVDSENLEELPAIETTIEGETSGVIPVRLVARVTEVGTLELAAVENSSGKRHKLEFNIRVE